MKIAALQTDIVWEDPAENFKRVEPMIRAAAASAADLALLPEMFATGFSMDAQRISEPLNGPTAAFLTAQARTHDIWVGGTFPLRHPDGRVTNHFLVVGPDGETHGYDKIHPFTFAGEDEHYAAGSTFHTVQIGDLRCTLFVCYDLRFADEFWATAPGTDAYLVVANWPAKRREHWRTLLRARAIENQAYVVGVNRVGRGNELDYAGDSAIIDPWGAVLSEASKDTGLVLAEVDPERVSDARAKFPVLFDRRSHAHPR